MDRPSSPSNSRDWFSRMTLKFYRYRSLVKRRWWILAITVGIGLFFEAWVVMRKPELHRSTGKLMVGGQFALPDGQHYREETDGYYGNQTELLRNPEVHEMARRRVAVDYPELTGNVEIEVELIPRTTIFEVTGTGTNPKYSQQFVEALMESFIRFKNEQRKESSSTQILQFTEQLSKLANDQEEAEQELKAFVEQNDMAFWEEQGKDAARFLSNLKTQQAQLTTELNRLETQGAEALLNSSAVGPGAAAPQAEPVKGSSGSAMVIGGGDVMTQYTAFKQLLVARQAELAERSRFWKPAHPGIEMIKNEIAGIQRSIDAIRDLTREAAEGRMTEIRSALVALDEDIARWQKKALEASRLNAEAERLKGQVTRIDNRYEKLLTSINQMDMSKEISRDPLMISQHASPAHRVPPQTLEHLATGGILGLLCGLAILYLIDRSDDRISSSTEMMEAFSESILGQIPDVDTSRTEAGLPLLGPGDQRYAFAESFRSLRSSLVFLPNQGELKTLLITSAIPGEGKSTIASNLAITMAFAGARVLLVDADLRRGDLAALFDIDERCGLSNVLRGEISWKSAVQPTRYQTLSIMPRGPVTNQSAELLLAPLLDPLLMDFKNGYDLTIFNTSPILATDDTPTLAPNFDGALMVLRAGFTPSRLTRIALEALYQRQVNVLGMILNCVNTDMPDYYYYRYPKYYAA